MSENFRKGLLLTRWPTVLYFSCFLTWKERECFQEMEWWWLQPSLNIEGWNICFQSGYGGRPIGHHELSLLQGPNLHTRFIAHRFFCKKHKCMPESPAFSCEQMQYQCQSFLFYISLPSRKHLFLCKQQKKNSYISQQNKGNCPLGIDCWRKEKGGGKDT